MTNDKKLTLLNTRPQENDHLTENIFADNGFNVINFPCIEIQCCKKNACTIIQKLGSINANSTIIFTSQHAVTCAYNFYPQWQILNFASVIAVGKKTSESLQKKSEIKVLTPEEQNSSGVIKLLKGSPAPINSITLITANQGRNKIQEHARIHNIPLQQINVYSRNLPNIQVQTLNEIENTENLYVLATSVTTLAHLKLLLPSKTWERFKNNTLVCASERIALAAKKSGFENCIIVGSANPQKISDFLLMY